MRHSLAVSGKRSENSQKDVALSVKRWLLGGGPDSETSRIVTCVDCCETRYVLEFHKLSVKYDRLFLGATSCPNFDFPAELFPYFVFRNSFRVQNYSFTVTIFMTCGASLDSY